MLMLFLLSFRNLCIGREAVVGRHRGHKRGEVRHNQRGRAGQRDRGDVPGRGTVRGHEPAGGGLQQRGRWRSRMGDRLGQVGGVCAAARIQLLHARRRRR